MAMNILKDEGYKMYYAKSGEMALKLIDENDFDLILLDIMMPEMNGFEVCLKLKSNDKTKNIPIIFLSGKDSSTDIGKAYEVGGIDYVVKPFITIELMTILTYTNFIIELEIHHTLLLYLINCFPTCLFIRKFIFKIYMKYLST